MNQTTNGNSNPPHSDKSLAYTEDFPATFDRQSQGFPNRLAAWARENLNANTILITFFFSIMSGLLVMQFTSLERDIENIRVELRNEMRHLETSLRSDMRAIDDRILDLYKLQARSPVSPQTEEPENQSLQ